MELNHVMLDIETFGTKSNSVIAAISAVYFDLESGDTGLEFNCLVDIQSCIDVGLKIDISTLKWWMGQSDQAREIVISGNEKIKHALEKFSNFVGDNKYIWGNSARFDLGILQNAYDACNIPIPWDFRKELDVRTLVFLNPTIKENFEYKGIKHNAIDDCKNQIDYCHLTYKSLLK